MRWGNHIFTGEIPRLGARQLPEDAAQVSENCWLDSRQPRPIPALETVDAIPAFLPSVKTIFRFDADLWFAWDDEVDVVRAPIFDDASNRTIWSGDDYPRFTSSVIMQGGGFNSPGLPVSRRLGIPVPVQAPTAFCARDHADDPLQERRHHLWRRTELLFRLGLGRGRRARAIPTGQANAAWLATYDADTTRHIQLGAIADGASTATVVDQHRVQGAWQQTGVERTVPVSQNLTAEFHAWVYTYLSDLDEEGPPSDPTAVVQRGFDISGAIETVEIRDLPSAVGGPYNITRKRIYRTATGAGGVTTYRLVATIPIVQATYEDSTATANLGAGLISTNWDPPPSDLKGFIALPNGVIAGFRGREVYFSEPYQPHAWPGDYVVVLEDDVVGLENFGTTVVVGTTGSPELISGADPATAAPAKMEFNQSCVSKGSFAYVDLQGVVYASPDGLVHVGPGGGKMISRKAYDRANWQELVPEDIRAVYHDGVYVAFLDGRAVAFDPEQEGVIRTDDDVRTMFHDRERDLIYVVDAADNRLKIWRTQGDDMAVYRTMRWRSRLHVGRPRTYSAAQVIATGYPVTFKLIANGVEFFASDIADANPFRLPASQTLYPNWEYEVSGNNHVEQVLIGAMHEMF